MTRYTSKLSKKGQLVIPAAFQRHMDLTNGEVVQLHIENSTIVIEPTQNWVEATRGTLATNHIQLEPEQLEALIDATALVDSFHGFGNEK